MSKSADPRRLAEAWEPAAALAEASRCLLCEDPPCRAGCPSAIDPRTFIRKIRFDDLAGAARHLREANILAGVCAELCPVCDLCVGRCLHEALDRPIDISGLQRFVCRWEREQGGPAVAPVAPWRERVAVIGAGPAGLAGAAELTRRGFAVTLFDREPEAGGLLRTTIPQARLPVEVLDHDISLVEALGVEFRMGAEVGTPAELLTGGYAAVLVAAGAAEPVSLRIPGDAHPRVRMATAFLRACRAGEPPALGRRVAVVGGGDTAIDAAREARRMGCDVTLLYRRDREVMPAYAPGVAGAAREGVELLYRVMPLEIIASDESVAVGASGGVPVAVEESADVTVAAEGPADVTAAGEGPAGVTAAGEGPVGVTAAGEALAGMRLQRVRWETGGRAARRYVADGEPFLWPCDDLLVAAGLQPAGIAGLETDKRGRIRHDSDTFMTSHPGVFVAGDVAAGPGVAVSAIAMAKAAAEAIDVHFVATRAQPGAAGASAGAAAGEEPARSLLADRERRWPLPVHHPPRADLRVSFCGLEFENPFLLAAGPPTDDLEMLRDAFRAGWAGAVLKTTSVEGTPVPLAYPMMSGMGAPLGPSRAMGNIDLISEHHIDRIAERIATLKKEFPGKVIAASITGSRREEWESLVARLEAAGVDWIECSFSCPQGTPGSQPGAMLGQDAALVREVAGWVKAAARRVPVVIKLTPQVADIGAIAEAAAQAGADGICASNTIPALMGIDLERDVPQPDLEGQSTYSGLSGPVILPITLRTVATIAARVDLPITGTGGGLTWRDAVACMLAGASTVQFCTAVMHFGFEIIDDLVQGLAGYLDRRELRTPRDLTGAALPRVVSHEALPRGRKVRAQIDEALCIRDGRCFRACYDGGHRAIRIGAERLPEIDPDRCVGCGLCPLVCPVPGCIRMVTVTE